MQIGIMIYEDNNELRESLCNLITFSKEMVVLGDYPGVEDVQKQVKACSPDVILMDIDMPGMDGISAVKQIRAFNRQVHIIMITVFDDNRHVLDAICAGASGYLLKKYIFDHLKEAIVQTMNGEAPMSPGIAKMVIQSMQQSPRTIQENNYNLTTRENEILGSLAKGNSYKMIAAELYISIDTVRTHIKNIYEKLQVHSQAQAVSKAVNEGLV